MKKFIEPGEPTYRYFFVKDAFESEVEMVERWDEDIKFKLDEDDKWTMSANYHPTLYSKQSLELLRNFNFYGRSSDYSVGYKIGVLRIGMYADGFHISLSTDDMELRNYVFEDINHYSGWTKEVAKVAPIANEIVKKIEQFIADKRKK